MENKLKEKLEPARQAKVIDCINDKCPTPLIRLELEFEKSGLVTILGSGEIFHSNVLRYCKEKDYSIIEQFTQFQIGRKDDKC